MSTEQGVFSIGKYRVIGTLGRGAMGVVYKAQDPEIGRTVAVKVLRSIESQSEKALQETLEQFKLEARSAGNLRHPHIITVFEVSSQGASPYIVMDYIDGQGLDQVLARLGALAPVEALNILSQIAEGLDYAHQREVIHRDIKPSNILIDSQGRAYLLDFGVATIGIASVASGSPVVGSPAYMSPEQILAKRLDYHSDLFSFAVLAFELLTGSRPFDGDNFNAVVSQILNNQPKLLSTLKPEFPLALELVFERALHKSPTARFSSAEEFVSELKRSLIREGVAVNVESANVPRKRVDSTWNPIELDGSLNRLLKESPDHALASRHKKDAFKVDPETDAWDRSVAPTSARQRPAGSAWGASLRPSSNFEHVQESLTGHPSGSRQRWQRLVLLLLGVVCLAVGSIIVWALFKPVAKLQDSEHQSNISHSEPQLESLEKPAILERERYDIPSLGKPVSDLTDREILGLLVKADFPIDDVLEAIIASNSRGILGRFEAFVGLLSNDSYVVRVEAIKALAAGQDRRFVPAVLGALEDHDPLVRIAAANGLRLLGDRRSVSYLAARMVKEDLAEVRGALKSAIEQINGFPLTP